MTDDDAGWAPEACTLPTAQRPLRVAEFDDLITDAVRDQRRLSPTVLRWWLDPAAEAVARDLAARETDCCSFFRFTFAEDSGGLRLDVEVPAEQTAVLDALAGRAATSTVD